MPARHRRRFLTEDSASRVESSRTFQMAEALLFWRFVSEVTPFVGAMGMSVGQAPPKEGSSRRRFADSVPRRSRGARARRRFSTFELALTNRPARKHEKPPAKDPKEKARRRREFFFASRRGKANNSIVSHSPLSILPATCLLYTYRPAITSSRR